MPGNATLAEFNDQHLWLQMLKQMRRGYISKIERRIVAEKDDIGHVEIDRPCAAQGEMIAGGIADLDRRRPGYDPAVSVRSPSTLADRIPTATFKPIDSPGAAKCRTVRALPGQS